jgi:hypothetical protein
MIYSVGNIGQRSDKVIPKSNNSLGKVGYKVQIKSYKVNIKSI